MQQLDRTSNAPAAGPSPVALEAVAAPGTLVSLSDADVIAGADREQRAYAARLRSFFTFIAEVDRRGLWDSDGCRDVVQWISGRYDETNHMARLMVDAAHAMESLPVISEAFAAGVISRDKAVHLARFATRADEGALLSWATRVTTRTVRKRAETERRKALTAAQRAEARERHVGVDASRYLQWWLVGDDEAVRIDALLPLAEGMAAVKALGRLAERKPRDPELIDDLDVAQFKGDGDQGPEDEADARTLDQRMADAFVDVCAQAIDADHDADRATVVVHADLAAVAGDGSGAELDGGARAVVAPEVLERLLCDCRLEVALRDGDRGLVAVGQARRSPSAWLFRQVLRRDGGCTFPGCGTRRYIASHHIVPWPGPTSYDNLTIVCGFHHKLVHERNWRVALVDDRAVWFRPGGAIYEPRGP